MAEEKKTPAKTTKKPAAKAAPTAKAASAGAAPAAKAAKVKAAPSGRSQITSGKATAAAPEGERCSVAKCTQPKRAKGLCRKHYMGWRRGKVGDAHRYKICTKEGCRKARTHGSLCAEHAGKETPAADAAAPAAPAAS
jgi:hypothetical protein